MRSIARRRVLKAGAAFAAADFIPGCASPQRSANAAAGVLPSHGEFVVRDYFQCMRILYRLHTHRIGSRIPLNFKRLVPRDAAATVASLRTRANCV
jgi:hypothetical protein